MPSPSRSPGSADAPVAAADAARFPWSGLLALACTAFLTILTEALPAGLLPNIAADLGVTEGAAGQLVTLYALGSLCSAIPLIAFTRRRRRRPLLMLAIGGFALVNLVTALSPSYPLTLVARFVAGVFAGLLWALVPGHAVRMVPQWWQGKAMAVAMAGTPVALSIGIPAGTLLGNAAGWRSAFVAMTVAALALLPWVWARVPDFPGQPAQAATRLLRVVAMPGVRPVLAVTLLVVLAHTILYTYVAPFLAWLRDPLRVDTALMLFGVASMAGIAAAGLWTDRWLRRLVLGGIAGFGLAAGALAAIGAVAMRLPSGTAAAPAAAVVACVALCIVLWGLSFGGNGTLFQTASARAAGEGADTAQSVIVTVWNLGIAGGGLGGAWLLHTWGAGSFAPALAALLAAAFAIAWRARSAGFAR